MEEEILNLEESDNKESDNKEFFSWEVFDNRGRLAYEDYFDTANDAKVDLLRFLQKVSSTCRAIVYMRYPDGEFGDVFHYIWTDNQLHTVGEKNE